MKNTLTLLLGLLVIGTAISCKKEGCTDETANNYDAEAKTDNGTCTYAPVVATLTTSTINAITINSATGGGEISNTGTHTIKVVGLCWSTTSNPTINDSKTTHFYNTNNFSSTMEGLTENTTYYVRAYATSDAGTAYGNEITFTTLQIGLPTLTTTTPTLMTTFQISTGGNITDDGYAAVTERGVCWGTTPNPTINEPHATDIGTGTGAFTLNLTNLQSETTYYIRAYATNSAGTAYGQEITYVNPHVSFIGEYYQGGVVFYLDQTGEHGLICALDDQSIGAAWGCQVVTGATLGNYFEGATNTSTIINNACNTPGIAADLCAGYSFGGYSDWFLPSTQELLTLQQNRNQVNNTATANGGSNLALNYYWSSTELDINSATVSYFNTVASTISSTKSDLNYVRAIRAF